jgi:hypothetical protein
MVGSDNDPGLAQEEGCFVFSGLTKRIFFFGMLLQ